MMNILKTITNLLLKKAEGAAEDYKTADHTNPATLDSHINNINLPLKEIETERLNEVESSKNPKQIEEEYIAIVKEALWVVAGADTKIEAYRSADKLVINMTNTTLREIPLPYTALSKLRDVFGADFELLCAHGEYYGYPGGLVRITTTPPLLAKPPADLNKNLFSYNAVTIPGRVFFKADKHEKEEGV